MTTSFWQPTSSLDILRLRARLYHDIRHFFMARQVLEVETPMLSSMGNPDPMIDPFYTEYHGPQPRRLFLHTSPELAMKRLLVAGSGSIYQITKAFRDGEVGRWHNPEFTLLEWYRLGFNQEELIGEVDELLQTLLHCPSAEQIDYCDLFEQYTGLHPLESPLPVLQHYAAQLNPLEEYDRDTCLQLIMSAHIEPALGQQRPVVVKAFPATQAALACRCQENDELSERFEFYVKGMELANGFYELRDPIEQRQRFEEDVSKRYRLDKLFIPLDERFLEALKVGLPLCSGVALGVDRLLMIMTNASHIREVMAFPIDRS